MLVKIRFVRTKVTLGRGPAHTQREIGKPLTIGEILQMCLKRQLWSDHQERRINLSLYYLFYIIYLYIYIFILFIFYI